MKAGSKKNILTCEAYNVRGYLKTLSQKTNLSIDVIYERTLIRFQHLNKSITNPKLNLQTVAVPVTPEERHVANMQINGYENPTYKYFTE